MPRDKKAAAARVIICHDCGRVEIKCPNCKKLLSMDVKEFRKAVLGDVNESKGIVSA